jgi:hypothetical protein
VNLYRGLWCLGGCVVVAAGLIWVGVSPINSAPIPKERPEREVPLKEIHTLGRQADLPKLGLVGQDDGILRGVKAIQDALQLHAASNLFVIRGDDLKAAVQDARSWVTYGDDKETDAERKSRKASNKRWLFVYLGYGPSHPMPAKLEAVHVYRDRVQVRYSGPDPAERWVTADSWNYAYWIPLGELKPGPVQFEIVDHATGEVELMRRVIIKGDK